MLRILFKICKSLYFLEIDNFDEVVSNWYLWITNLKKINSKREKISVTRLICLKNNRKFWTIFIVINPKFRNQNWLPVKQENRARAKTAAPNLDFCHFGAGAGSFSATEFKAKELLFQTAPLTLHHILTIFFLFCFSYILNGNGTTLLPSLAYYDLVPKTVVYELLSISAELCRTFTFCVSSIAHILRQQVER